MSNETTLKECVFCSIVKGHSPAHIICEDELSLALLDINPLSQGHTLVIPKRHVPWWYEMTPEEIASLYGMASKVADMLLKTFKPDFICQYARGRRIPHTHIFLVPTFSGDILDRFFNTIELVQEGSENLSALKQPDALADTAEMLCLMGRNKLT